MHGLTHTAVLRGCLGQGSVGLGLSEGGKGEGGDEDSERERCEGKGGAAFHMRLLGPRWRSVAGSAEELDKLRRGKLQWEVAHFSLLILSKSEGLATEN